MSNAMALQSGSFSSGTFGGAAIGLAVAIVVGLGGHKVVYGSFFPTKAPIVMSTPSTDEPAQAPVQLVVRANAPTARMNFRGTSLPLPHDAPVTASGMSDYVEVTAPGYEGRRFWLRFDRPRSLVVTLPPGSGVIDATFDETQIALGRAVGHATESDTTAASKKPAQDPTTPRQQWVAQGARHPAAPDHPAAAAAPASAAAPPPLDPAPAPPPAHPAGAAKPTLDKNPWDNP